MKILTDIEIAQSTKIEKIEEIAKKINVDINNLELYGPYKAKINKKLDSNTEGRLILVTAINPTTAGEGKTTTSIGLADALKKISKSTILCLREPSLGPVFGMKGGACGGGYAQVIPMEDINLHFTGDLHAVTTTHNLLSALIDNSIYQGNPLNIDPNNITWKRVVDLNDRALREVRVGLGKKNGISRGTGFDITVSSEIMAILCLSKDLNDMKERFSKIIIGYTYDGKPVTVHDLKAEGSMAVIMKDAIKPNLVQTLEGTPTIIHGGPFANIAHGCNSIIATKTALNLADYVVTEAGFGADLGAEKFFDLKCRIGSLKPDIAVIVATVRALKLHGGLNKNELTIEDINALKLGLKNLEKHIENIKKFNIPCIVALNSFDTDTKNELSYVKEFCKNLGIEFSISEVFSKGGVGAIDLANKVVELIDNNKENKFSLLYKTEDTLQNKILTITKEIYGASSVKYSESASKMIKKINEMGFSDLPICIAKTQYSLSDDKDKIGRPENFDITISEVRLASGAGFIVCIAGSIMTMPGLPKEPAANNIDITIEEDGKTKIIGLF